MTLPCGTPLFWISVVPFPSCIPVFLSFGCAHSTCRVHQILTKYASCWPKDELDAPSNLHCVQLFWPLPVMVDELSVLLIAAFVAGLLLGSLFTMLFSHTTPKLPSPEKNHCPSEVWISRAGEQYHLHGDCPSLRVDGKQRRGVVEFKVCCHCLKNLEKKTKWNASARDG